MVGVMGLYRSSIGRKVIMAVTGLIWIGFIVFHLYGNLKLFAGQAYFNAYAEGLREIGSPVFGHGHLLIIGRVVMIGAFLSHVWAAVTLNQRNKQSRSSAYVKHTKLKANYANLTMIWGGAAIFLFVIYHLMHFTGGVSLVHSNFDPHDPYANVVIGFQSIPAVIIYLVAVVALGFHLFHGIWSVFQTLGLNNRTYTDAIRMVAVVISIVVPIGFAIIPLAVLIGVVV